MEPSEYKSTLPLEILATSLVTRLTLDELEWLSRVLAQRTNEKSRKERGIGYRDAWTTRDRQRSFASGGRTS
jgi:hypothetical protein